MKRRALLASSIREIIQSPARFFSILGIIFLGVAFFVGIGATGPDMLRSADNYYKKQHLADVTVISSLGFSKEDQAYLEEKEAIQQVDGQYMVDIQLADNNDVVRIFSYRENQLNQLKLDSGRLPKKDEIVLDSRVKGRYKLGDTLSLPTDQFTEKTVKIVGFITSPEFIDNSQRGNTTVGSGAIDYIAFLPEENFQMDDYVRLLISFKNVANVEAYSDTYDQRMSQNQEDLKHWLAPRKELRLQEIKETANKELAENRQQVNDGEKQLTEAEQQLQKAKEQLEAAELELNNGKETFANEIAAAKKEIQTREAQITQSETELHQKETLLTEKQREVDKQSGVLSANEDQLNQLSSQKEQLNTTLEQLKAANESYLELASLLADIDSLSEEELANRLEQIRTTLRIILTQLPASEEWSSQIDALLSQVTPETVTEVVQGLSYLGNAIQSQMSTLENSLAQLEAGIAELADGKAQLQAAQQQLDEGKMQIADGKQQLSEGKRQLAEGKQQLALEEEKGQTKLATAEAEWQQGKKEYETQLAEFKKRRDEELPKLKEAQQKLENEQKKLDALQPASYTYLDRESNPGYAEYQDNAKRISSIATVFPTIFFLIAALVSLTTMGRMIEEKRVEIGTLKALGYKNYEIAQKFLIYSLSAGLVGSLLGLIVGFYLFPTIIISAYGQLYNIKEFVTPWYLGYSLIGIVVALICTVGISLIALRVDLFSTPAMLLRPKAPKAGKRIWLEYITPIWNRVSFIQKVTMRNLFRYKSRMLMTIFGIAGCTAMILTGFGLKNSIADIVPVQFSNIWHYQGIVTFKDGEERSNYEQTVTNLKDYESRLAISSETLTVKGAQDITVYVPEATDQLAQFVSFNNRETNQHYPLKDNGAVINEKLATLTGAKVGDMLTLTDADNQEFTIEISAIAENYVGHFAYLSPTYYHQVFKKQPKFNTELLRFKQEQSKKEEQEVAKSLMAQENVINVSFLSDSSTALDETTGTLNIVVWVLIISAGLLAFIVLYNLNNINISERIRELSTIKVLGFYDKEVTMYIYRENILLTILGILVGLFTGQILHGYVLQTVEMDMIMFSPRIHMSSYFYASLITIVFTVVVGIVMYLKLKKVDMIEALKSNE
ncbi:FtsX-like permease family protein [Candidatus Enterococcus willemsii]|uniref:Permease n=1 Tax=Candidatus Enterococcus willemsii TaxID=1857215 RepID=A0ABQ6Z1Q0_9ENTE|nr:FtsX-like permease family protein [Enterococcus sp. CU12B]KAF1305266.1 permease [Enterococcus sp. CU12B]